MSIFNKLWFKPAKVLLFLFALSVLLPNHSIDSWNLFNLKKIATLIFALTFIQVLGSALKKFLGEKAGSIAAGFLGGLISSTATIANLAKNNKLNPDTKNVNADILTFLAATSAMLFEGLTLLIVNGDYAHLNLIVIFIGPLLMTFALITFHVKKINDKQMPYTTLDFKIIPILKLSAFILFVLALSKIMQNFIGQNGLYILTFIVSLFEVHGSIIANIQMQSNNLITTSVLSYLLVLSILASFVSKFFLIFTLANSQLKKETAKNTLYIFLALILSLVLFTVFN